MNKQNERLTLMDTLRIHGRELNVEVRSIIETRIVITAWLLVTLSFGLVNQQTQNHDTTLQKA